MKASAILCTVLAGSLGFGSLASAQERGDRPGRGHHAEQRGDGRHDGRHHGRHDGRWGQDGRHGRWDDRRDGHPGYVRAVPNHVPRHGPPAYVYSAPRPHGWGQPVYGAHGPRFHRGGYLPYEYRDNRYYVGNWHAYPGLYAPPHGHQWVRVGSDFVLVALATGLIANLLLQ